MKKMRLIVALILTLTFVSAQASDDPIGTIPGSVKPTPTTSSTIQP